MRTIKWTLRWAALGIVLLVGPVASAQWQGKFTGVITNVDDAQNFFQGLVQVGTPFTGHLFYDPSRPDDPSNGTAFFTLGTVKLTNYYQMGFSILNDDFDGSDSVSFLTYTLHPPEFKQDPAHYVDGGVTYHLVDPSGTALSSSDFIDLPLGNSWLPSFAVAEGQFQVFSDLDTVVAKVGFQITSFETSLVPMLLASPSFITTTETNGSVTVTVKRAGDSSSTATVDFFTSDLTAAAGLDYTATAGTLTFPAGVTSQSFTVSILDDSLREGFEYFSVQFTNIVGAWSNAGPATVFIEDDEPAPPYVYASSAKVTESDGSVTVVLSRFGDLSEGTTLDYATADDTAVAVQDYTPVSGSFAFAPNETTKTITIAITKDNIQEKPERFQLVFTNIIGATPSSFTTPVTIYDPAPLNVDLTFDPGVGADGPVYDLIPVPNGKIYALGSFTNIGGQTRPFVARLNANGSVDKKFIAGQDQGGFDSELSQLARLPNGQLLVCGRFTSIGGVQQQGLARLDEQGDLDRSFHPILDGSVGRFAVQPDGRIVIVGEFTHVNGLTRNYIARLNARGQIDPTFNAGDGPDYPPATVALEPDGKILVGGFFFTFSGASRRAAARLLPNGKLDSGYDLKIDDYGPYFFPYVRKFLVRPDGSHFLIGLSIYQVAGVYVNGNPPLVNNDGTLNKTYSGYTNSLFANRPPTAAEVQSDGGVLLSGMFQYVPFDNPDPPLPFDDSFSLFRIKPDGSVDFSIDPVNFPVTEYFNDTGIVVLGQVFDVAIQADGKVLIAGDFKQVSGVPRKGMARIIIP